LNQTFPTISSSSFLASLTKEYLAISKRAVTKLVQIPTIHL